MTVLYDFGLLFIGSMKKSFIVVWLLNACATLIVISISMIIRMKQDQKLFFSHIRTSGLLRFRHLLENLGQGIGPSQSLYLRGQHNTTQHKESQYTSTLVRFELTIPYIERSETMCTLYNETTGIRSNI